MKHTIWNTLEVFLRLPEVPAYVPGRVNRSTGRAEYHARLAAPDIWAEEIRIAEMNASRNNNPTLVAGRGAWRYGKPAQPDDPNPVTHFGG